ncbi:MAG: iron ABC transporter permease [Bacteroidota bacterium]
MSTTAYPREAESEPAPTRLGRLAPSLAAPHKLADALEAGQRRRRLVTMALVVLLLGGLVLSLTVGAVQVPLRTLGQILWDALPFVGAEGQASVREEAVILQIRMPRFLLALFVGAGLSLSGALMQGLFRNPLADPTLIGVSSGAALGAATGIVLGSQLAILSGWSIGAGAFAMGLLVAVIVYRIATRHGRTSVESMLLAGIAVNALCAALLGVLVLFADDGQLRDLTFWTLGALGGATWTTLIGPMLTVVGLLALITKLAPALNAMALGEAEAAHLGIHTQRVKYVVIGLAALTVAAGTAVSGLIGFVGLVGPHIVRLMVGPNHRYLLPLSALAGACLLLYADVLARTALAPSEIPIGIVTALIGAPFFLWLLLQRQR